MSMLHILTEILNTPLMVTPAKLQTIMSILDQRSERPLNLDLSALAHMSSANGAEVQAEARPVNEVDQINIAVHGIGGSLIDRSMGFNGASGLRSYRSIKNDITKSLNNREVGGMILDLNSFGGASAGCERITRFIREADSHKPIYGVVDLSAYSACYSIATGCRKIILTDNTAGVGSIGCIAIHCDYSKLMEKEGLDYTVVTFGRHKDDMSPYKPLSKEELQLLQRSVDGHGMRFAKTVAELRGLDLQQVLDTEARCYTGQDAVDIGLADEIASFDDAVAMLAAEIEDSKRTTVGGFSMNTQERMSALLQAEDGPQAIAALGYVKKESLTAEGYITAESAAKSQAEAVAAAKSEQQDLAVQVAELCQLADVPVSMAAKMLKEGLSVVEAQETLQQQRANNSKKTTVKSTITPVSGDGKHALVAACEAMNK